MGKLPGFSKWHKIGEKLESHVHNKSHSDAVAEACGLKEKFENPFLTLPYEVNTQKAERVQHNREVLKWVIKTIELCGKQCIAYRGHRESITSNAMNSGNFLAILKLIAETNIDVKNHLNTPVAKNAMYISPKIQNEIINIIGYDILQAELIEEIKEAKFFSILADEVESHKVEQLPICIRFVDKSNDIREEFLEFSRCEQINGKAIAREIVRVLEKAGLNIKNCRGQGYDGAGNMASEAIGVQREIKNICEKAVYTHCCGHNLNLVITTACKITIIQNTLDIVKEVTLMFVKVIFFRDILCFNLASYLKGTLLERKIIILFNWCQ